MCFYHMYIRTILNFILVLCLLSSVQSANLFQTFVLYSPFAGETVYHAPNVSNTTDDRPGVDAHNTYSLAVGTFVANVPTHFSIALHIAMAK